MNYDETVFVNPDKLGLDEGDTLDELYRKLGKAYYEGAFEDPLPQLLPLFDKITKIKGLSAGRGQSFGLFSEKVRSRDFRWRRIYYAETVRKWNGFSGI